MKVAFTPSKLLAYSALGVLLGLGMCGLGLMVGINFASRTKMEAIATFVAVAGGLVFYASVACFFIAIVWAIVEGIVNASRKKSP